jgi:hypothetical protein
MAKGVPSLRWDSLFYWATVLFGLTFGPYRLYEKEHAMDHKNPTLKKPAASPAPISIRYVCDMNGEQVGLSHYLMTEGRQAR